MRSDLRYPVDLAASKPMRPAADALLRHGCRMTAWCLMATIWVSPAQAALPDELAACRAIGSDAQRLACYDALSRRATAAAAPSALAPAAPVAAPAPAAITAAASATAVAPVEATVEHSFGAETVTKNLDSGPQSLKAELVGDVDGIRRHAVFHLDNGQVWQSIDDNEYEYEADHPKLTIDRNFAGSYWMHLENAHFNVRVSRVQ